MRVKDALGLFEDNYVGRKLILHVLELLLHTEKSIGLDIFLYLEYDLSDALLDEIERLRYEYEVLMKPLAYVLGYELFCGERFEVDENVLIPRAETEYVVKYAVDSLQRMIDGFHQERKNILIDVGTGSGCVGISIMKECGDYFDRCYLLDISKEALKVAERNSTRILEEMGGSNEKVECLESDLLESLPLTIND